MADQAFLLQKQIRDNAQDLGDFLGDLNKWEQDIKKKDEELKKTNAIEQLHVAPIRKKVKSREKKKSETEAGDQEKQRTIQQKPRISSYDYDSWSKFDVDAACDKIDKEEEDINSEESEEEEDLEAAQEIEEQRRLQRALLEKDKGNDLFKDGKFEAAINRYTIAAELDPRNAIVFANRAMALLKLERYAAAEEDCCRSLAVDSEYAKAIARRATARTKLKKFQGAIEDYEHLVVLQPNNKQAITELDKLKKELQKIESESSKSQKLKRRSNKPLKRIVIEEIGSEDEGDKPVLHDRDKTSSTTKERSFENKQTIDHDRPFSKKSQPRKADPFGSVPDLFPYKYNEIIPIVPESEKPSEEELIKKMEFQVPTTPVQFETDFQKIKKDIEAFYKYFSAIPTNLYKSLFHHSIDDVLPRALECFHKFYKRDEKEYWEELSRLAEVPRFEMARMFLSKNSKILVQDIFEELLKKRL